MDSTMRRTSRLTRPMPVAAMLAIVGVGPVLVLRADAFGAGSAATCAAAKIRASAKRVLDEGKCHQKALLVAAAVDPACLARAETRFVAAVARAEISGPCPGSVSELRTIVGDCVESIATSGVTTTTTSSTTSTTSVPGLGTCCEGASMCLQAAADCSTFGGPAPGPAGTVCDGTTGACAAPPVAGGPCCHVPGLFCLAGPNLNQTNCESLTGTFSASATCTPTGCVP